jgi:hypothetical protein
MTSHTLRAFIEQDNNVPKTTDPSSVLSENYPSLPDTVEVDQLAWGRLANQSDFVGQTAITPSGLEMSQPPSPRKHEAVDVVQSFLQLRSPFIALAPPSLLGLNVDLMSDWALIVQG